MDFFFFNWAAWRKLCVINREPRPSDVFSGRREKRGINRVNLKRMQTDFKGPFGNQMPGLCCSHLSSWSEPRWYLLLLQKWGRRVRRSRDRSACAVSEITRFLACGLNASQYCSYGVIFK